MQANPALGVQAFFNSTAATAALLSVGPCEERLRCLFLSLLVQPGTLLFKRGADKSDIGYVLSVSEFAALVWRVSPHIADGKRFITFETPPNKPVWEYWAITSLADWVCQATDVMLPSVGALDGGDTSGSIGVGVPSDAQHSILRYSAEHGFKGMTITFLKRLVVSLDIVPNEGETNPTREFELVKVLIQHVFPDVDEETIAMYMARRHSKWDVRFCSDLRHADIADVVDVLGEQDASEFASEVKAYMKQAEEDKEKAKTAAAAAKPKPKKMPKVKKMHVEAPRLHRNCAEALALARASTSRRSGTRAGAGPTPQLTRPSPIPAATRRGTRPSPERPSCWCLLGCGRAINWPLGSSARTTFRSR